ncbi:MAG: hypothetical protein ACR2I0_09920, partial [Rhodoferax sp.]
NIAATGAVGFDYGKIGGAGGAAGATNSAAAPSSSTLRARLTTRFAALPQAEAFLEHEQSVQSPDQQVNAVGGTFALTEKTRIYGRHELSSSMPVDNSATLTASNTVFGIESAYMEGGRIYNEARLGPAGGQTSSGVRNTFKLNDQWSLSAGLERTQVTSSATSGTTASAAGQGNSRAISLGADYSDGALRASSAIENRLASESTSNLFALGLAYKIGADWTLLGRTNSTFTNSATAGLQILSRQQVGLAWRPAESDTFNGLLRFENRREYIGSGSTGSSSLAGDTLTQIATVLGSYNPRPGYNLTTRLAVKNVNLQDAVVAASYQAGLLHLRATHDIGTDWDLGLQTGLFAGQGGAAQSAVGLEVGYMLMKNLWLSGGYNFTGLNDPDLAGANYTKSGAYVRLRFKFDETTLGLADAPGPAPSPAAAARRDRVDASAPKAEPAATASLASAALPAPPQADSASVPVTANAPQADPDDDGPLKTCQDYAEALWFASPDSAQLSTSGKSHLQRLVRRIKEKKVDSADLEFSLAHGETNAERDRLWLQRTAVLRRALAAEGLAGASFSIDTQPVPPATAAQPYTQGTLRIMLCSSASQPPTVGIAAVAP